MSKDKNYKILLIISALPIIIGACTSGNSGGGGGNKKPMTAKQIRIPSNFSTTTSSNLFFTPGVSNVTNLFIPSGAIVANQLSKQQSAEAGFDSLVAPLTITPTGQTLINPGDLAFTTLTIATAVAGTSSAVPLVATDLVDNGDGALAATYMTTGEFNFDNSDSTAFYSAIPAVGKNKRLGKSSQTTIAAVGTIGGVTTLYTASAVALGEQPQSPEAVLMYGSPCNPSTLPADVPTALNNVPTLPDLNSSFVVGTQNGNICTYAPDGKIWTPLTTSATPGNPLQPVMAVQSVQYTDEIAQVVLQTTSRDIFVGRASVGQDGNLNPIDKVVPLTSVPGAPTTNSITPKTMFVDEFGDVLVGGTVNGNSVVYFFDSENSRWYTITLEQFEGIPERAPVVSISPSMSGTIMVGVSSNANGDVNGLYELI